MKTPAMIAAELRRLTASPMAVLALLALMLVPVLYGGLYLWANQDPYARLNEIPVALVVADEGVAATEGTEAQNYGQGVADELLAGNAFDWQLMDAAVAAQALHEGEVDFTVTIPADFSEALVSGSTENPRRAEITLETNDANNYLASTIGSQAVEKIRREVTELVNKEAASRMLTGLGTVRTKIAEAADGASQLSDGVASAIDGTSQLSAGATDLSDGAATLAGKLGELGDGTATLVDGSAQVADGARQVADGVATIRGYADTAGSASQTAIDALPTIRQDITDRLLERGLTPEEAAEVVALLDPLDADLKDGNSRIQEAVSQIDQLSDGAEQVADGASDVSAGAVTVDDAVGQLHDGALTLSDGTVTLGDGIGELATGLGELADGAEALHSGLVAGASEIPLTDDELRELQAGVIADPVDVNTGNLAAAGQYGAGLAPFFAALAGWIGIYALFLIVKPVSKRAITALRSPVRITLSGWATPAALGALQMVGLFLVLSFVLQFSFEKPWETLGTMVLASLTYTAIIMALNVWLGSVGQFLALVFMVLQLVTAGGTFPWQTLPEPLAALHHVLPMGFVVDAMRQFMYGGDLGRVAADYAVLLAWLLGGLVLTMLGVARMVRRRTMRDLAPSLIG
ncbi:YhgE/Pip domain-containing protein [Tessaracoccus terricola]